MEDNTLYILDSEVFDNPKYYTDDSLKHLINGYLWFMWHYLSKDSYYPFLYNTVISVVSEYKDKPMAFRKGLAQSWIDELEAAIDKLKQLITVHNGKKITIQSFFLDNDARDIISYYYFEINVLSACIQANFEGLEFDNSLTIVDEIDTQEVDFSTIYTYPYIDFSTLTEDVIFEYELEYGRNAETGKLNHPIPIEDIIYSELNRRGIYDEIPSEKHSFQEFRELLTAPDFSSKKEEHNCNVADKLSDKQRAAVLYYMLADTLRRCDKEELLVKVISFVNGKDYDEKKKSNCSAYNYVHHPDKLDNMKRFAVEQLKRYGLEEELKKVLTSAEQLQFGLV